MFLPPAAWAGQISGTARLRGRYGVRATLRQGERLLYTTDTFTTMPGGGTSAPLTLQLVADGSGRRWQLPTTPNLAESA